MITAIPFPQHIIESGVVKAEALVSVSGTDYPVPQIDPALFSNRVLRLTFDDIPNAAWTDHNGRAWTGPSEDQVAQVLEFTARVEKESRWGGTVAVHCLHGRSRSAALAIAINAQSRGPGQEDAAVSATLRGCSLTSREPMEAVLERLSGNPGIIRMADRLLGRNGAIEAAMDRAIPRFTTWKTYWRMKGCIE